MRSFVKLLPALAGMFACLGATCFAQTLNLPPRATNAITGSQFVNLTTPMPAPSPGVVSQRESWIFSQIAQGNVPNFLRNLVPVTATASINGTNHTVRYYVTPDYMAVGSDTDYFLQPMTPLLAQRLANLLNCSLPTRKMVNQIWTNASVKLAPAPITWSPQMVTVPVFDKHNSMVWSQREPQLAAHPLGALVAGHKKDVILSTLIYTNLKATVPHPVVIYGWHYQDGSWIQNAYNGHEETYADYSHGIRLIQNPITVDETNTTTVQAVLTNPQLAALLSDETNVSSSFIIPTPYYSAATVTSVAPAIVTPPVSRSIRPGTNVQLSVVAAGDLPLSFQWRFNGANIAGATNSVLLLNDVQPTKAGSYSVRVSNTAGSVISPAAAIKVGSVRYPTRFADTFDWDSSASWNLVWESGNGIADYSADWALDHRKLRSSITNAVYFIPTAPNTPDGSTRAVKLTVNGNDTNGAIAGVNIYPKGRVFSGNLSLKFDMWVNYPGAAGGAGSTGSTQYPIFGLNHSGTRANWAATSASSTDGLWFAVDGEGGVNNDYRAFQGNLSGLQTELIGPGASGLAASNNTAPFFQTLFPASQFETAGSPGKCWVEVELNQVDGVLTWKMNDATIAQRTNTSPFSSGTIMLGLMDTYASVASPAEDAFVLFDNVRVEDLSVAPVLAPTIQVQPAGIDCDPGTSLMFRVAVTGSVPLSYQWSWNGTVLTGQTDATLLLTNVQPANAGMYQVRIANAAGSVTSEPATLTVSGSPSGILSSVQLLDRQLLFTVLGLTNAFYVVECSTNLVSWFATQTNRPPFQCSNALANDWNSGFYRARVNPM